VAPISFEDFNMLIDFETDSTASATEIAGLRATFDNGGSIDVVAACALLSIEDATENDRRRAGQPASVAAQAAPIRTTSTPATVTAADRAKVRAIRARVNAADAKAALLEEIGRKHGTDAANAARDLGLADLLKRAASPTRAEIAASWEKVFRARGIELQHEDDPTETPIQQSWSRAFARLGFKV
jgi:hypothetical protein